MNILKKGVILCVSMILLISCQKEYSFEVGNGNPGVTPTAQYSWSFTGTPATDFRGCIDTAFFTTVNGVKAFMFNGTDSAGNVFHISLASANITTGTYTSSQGLYISLTDNNGSVYLPQQPENLSFQVTRINDTLIEATFSGTLANQITNQPFSVTGGKLKALIGKFNPCTMSSGTGIPAVFSLAATANTCSNAVLEGEYSKGTALNSSNYVELIVNVTAAGDWNITTQEVNGISFSGRGVFTGTGLQSVVLMGTGTPANAASTSIPVTTGTSNCSFIVQVDDAVPGSVDYFPTTANSFWVYHVMELATGAEDSTMTGSIGATVQVNQVTYSILENDFFGYVYRKANGEYFRYGPIDIVGVIDTAEAPKEVIFLKDNVPTNTTWESVAVNFVFNGTPVKYKRRFTITAKDVSLTIRGQVYNNVITVKEDFMLEIAGTGYSVVESSIISYAKGIGMIQFRNDTYQLAAEIKRFQVF